MDIETIASWYSGKGLETLRNYVGPTLIEAEKLGYWPKGASRKVRAAISKQKIAEKFAKVNERDWNLRDPNPSGLLVDIKDKDSKLDGWNLNHAMMFGQVLRAPSALELADKLAPFCRNDSERAALERARKWATDFTPFAKLIELLDMSRPKITVRVMKTLSPLVAKNVGEAMGVKLDTIEMPEIKYEWRLRMMMIAGKATQVRMLIGTIVWPQGTQHNRSRHAHKNSNCHACGHMISNAFNWIPLVAKTDSGPVSLWVGRDCAKNLFGCEVEGEGEFVREEK